jgi:Disulphide bond corrector protein DsbC
MRTSLSLVAAAIALVAGCKPAVRESAANNPVKWTLSPAVTELRADSVTAVHLAAAIDDGWYIYAITQKEGGPIPMSVDVAPSPPFHIQGSVEGPAPVVVFDKEFGITTERYKGTPSFTVPVAAVITAGAQPQALDVKVRFQACSATFCLPARTVTLTNRVQVAVR